MTPGRRSFVAASFGLALTACAQLAPPERSVALPGTPGVVATREDLSRRFVTFVGPKTQHAPPFLDTPGTNFYCLRSFLDRKTGAVAYQVYVSDSYFGAERGWDAARDKAGDRLGFVHISTNEISCDAGCSYAEEFAAAIPENELRASPQGLAVTFTARSGDEKTINLSADQIDAQLAAVDTGRHNFSPAAAAVAPRE